MGRPLTLPALKGHRRNRSGDALSERQGGRPPERLSPVRIVLSPAEFVFRPAPSTSMRRRATMPMTREEIISVLGPTDKTLIADILSTGASFEELREAWA